MAGLFIQHFVKRSQVRYITELAKKNEKKKMNEQSISLLRRQLNELNKIGTNPSTQREFSFGVEAWKSSTISILERIYGEESKKIELVDNIQLGRTFSSRGPAYYHLETVKETGSAILEACIAELESLGLPENKYDGTSKGINLTVVQSQSNQQTIKLELLVSIIRNELTGKQIDEIQSILNEPTDTETKKKKVFDKVKDFGINTLSNIISGILSNPQIWGI